MSADAELPDPDDPYWAVVADAVEAGLGEAGAANLRRLLAEYRRMRARVASFAGPRDRQRVKFRPPLAAPDMPDARFPGLVEGIDRWLDRHPEVVEVTVINGMSGSPGEVRITVRFGNRFGFADLDEPLVRDRRALGEVLPGLLDDALVDAVRRGEVSGRGWPEDE